MQFEVSNSHIKKVKIKGEIKFDDVHFLIQCNQNIITPTCDPYKIY